MRNARRGLICLVGIDGSGKTTHALSLCRRLSAMHLRCAYIRPRYELARLIPLAPRQWIEERLYPYMRRLTVPNKTTKPRKRSLKITRFPSLFFLLAYALATHLFIIRPLLRNSIVICDRYFYDWFYDPHSLLAASLMRLLPVPDFAVFLDVPVAVALSRMSSQADRDVSPEYFRSLRRWYSDIANQYGFATVDSTRNHERTSCAILGHIMRFLEAGDASV